MYHMVFPCGWAENPILEAVFQTSPGSPGIRDLAWCRKALADYHAELTDDIQGDLLRDTELLQEYLEEVRIADAIYEPDVARCNLLPSMSQM